VVKLQGRLPSNSCAALRGDCARFRVSAAFQHSFDLTHPSPRGACREMPAFRRLTQSDVLNNRNDIDLLTEARARGTIKTKAGFKHSPAKPGKNGRSAVHKLSYQQSSGARRRNWNPKINLKLPAHFIPAARNSCRRNPQWFTNLQRRAEGIAGRSMKTRSGTVTYTTTAMRCRWPLYS
jgi:hypothetical protein